MIGDVSRTGVYWSASSLRRSGHLRTSGTTDTSDFLRRSSSPGCAIRCSRTGGEGDFSDEEHEHEHRLSTSVKVWGTGHSIGPQPYGVALGRGLRGALSPMQCAVPVASCSFKLVVLGYSMFKNADRGLDSFVIKCCNIDHEKTPVDIPPVDTSCMDSPQMSEIPKPNPTTSGVVDPPASHPQCPHLGPTSGKIFPTRRSYGGLRGATRSLSIKGG